MKTWRFVLLISLVAGYSSAQNTMRIWPSKSLPSGYQPVGYPIESFEKLCFSQDKLGSWNFNVIKNKQSTESHNLCIIEKIDFFQNDIVSVAPKHFAAGSAAGVYSSDTPRIRRHSSGIALSVHSRGAGPVRMSLYDMQGRCVAVLYDGAPQGSSFDVIVRNGVVSHGVYVLRTVIDGRKAIARFVVN